MANDKRSWKLETAGADTFEPIARALEVEAEDIVAAVRNEGDLMTVFYTAIDDDRRDHGYMAIIQIDEKAETLTVQKTEEVPGLVEKLDELLYEDRHDGDS